MHGTMSSTAAVLGGTALSGFEREEVRRSLPDERFVVVEGGHSLHREHPEQITALTSEFAHAMLN